MIRLPIRLSKSHPSHPALPITFHRVLLTPYSFSLSIFNSIPPRCSLIYRSSLSFSFSIFSIRISFYPGEVSHPSGNVFPFPFSHYSPRNNSNRNLISQLFRDPVISESVNRTKIKCEEYRRKLEKRKYLSIKRRRRWRRSEATKSNLSSHSNISDYRSFFFPLSHFHNVVSKTQLETKKRPN